MKMKVFSFNEKYLRFCGLFLEQKTNFRKKIRKFVVNCIFLFGLLYSFTFTPIAYIFYNMDDVSGSMMAFVNFCAGISTFGSYVGVMVHLRTIHQLHFEVQTVVDNGKWNCILILFFWLYVLIFNLAAKQNIVAFNIYRDAEQKCQLYTKWISFAMVFYYTLANIVPITVHSIICVISGNFDTATWLFFANLHVPFDTSTVFGWYIRFLIHIIGGYPYCFTITCIFPYLASICFYIEACCKQFKQVIHKCDETVSIKGFQLKNGTSKNLKEELKKAIILNTMIRK